MYKPKVGDVIYIIRYLYGAWCIEKTRVWGLGLTQFCTDMTFDLGLVEAVRGPLSYEDYGVRWFTSFEDVKKQFKSDSVQFEQITKDYWEARQFPSV